MPRKKRLILLLAVLIMAYEIIAAPKPILARSKVKVLHAFTGKDGGNPYDGVIFDAAGNLYGTTVIGGAYNAGTVFELTPSGDGEWKEKVLYSFSGKNESAPEAGVILDTAGDLYGMTTDGGAGCNIECGSVYELSPGSANTWTKKVLHTFKRDGVDGYFPGLLVFDGAGSLYGTTLYGGYGNGGVVFKLTPDADGAWTEKVLYSFCSQQKCTDGDGPSSLIFDAGNLYGTTGYGGLPTCGSAGCGTFFQLSRDATGKWSHKILHTFHGWDGALPFSLVFDAAGNLYGATEFGGRALIDGGTVFKLTPDGNGQWTEAVLHSFYRQKFPSSPVIFDAAGNLYGLTYAGGTYGIGTAFKLTLDSNRWNSQSLYSFQRKRGASPEGNLIMDAGGNLYGTTTTGGVSNSNCLGNFCGVVFKITP
jgi:uncharacterized repeat protein (TIGR03803 family)